MGAPMSVPIGEGVPVMSSEGPGVVTKGASLVGVLQRLHGQEVAKKALKRKRKAGGKWSKVKQRKEREVLTRKEKREKRITGQSLGRARHVYKVVNGDWPLAPAMYLSDVSSPSMLRPVLLVDDPLKRYFESPHGNGMQEIMPDRVRNAELRRLLGLSPEDEPRCVDRRKEHLELVRMCEARWPKCPISYEGLRPEQFNDSNHERDRVIKEVLLDPINELCRQVGLKGVKAYWMFHCPSEARGIGYYSGRWSANRSLQYTDDKLFMTAYALFCQKYEKSAEGPRPSKENPPGRAVEFVWKDDNSKATDEIVTEKQLAEWEEVVKKRKGVLMRKGDCPTVRRKAMEDMQKLGGKWAFEIKDIRSVCLKKKKTAKEDVGNVRMSVVYYWPEDRVEWEEEEARAEWEKTKKPEQDWDRLDHTQKRQELAMLLYVQRNNIKRDFPERYAPAGGQDLWKLLWDKLEPSVQEMYMYKSVTQIGSMPVLAETLYKHLVPHLHPHKERIQAYVDAWETLDIRLQNEHTWAANWDKIVPHIEHLATHL